MAILLNKKDMAASIGISVQAFDKWGVTPTERRGREVFFDVRSVLENRRAHHAGKEQPDSENDAGIRVIFPSGNGYQYIAEVRQNSWSAGVSGIRSMPR